MDPQEARFWLLMQRLAKGAFVLLVVVVAVLVAAVFQEPCVKRTYRFNTTSVDGKILYFESAPVRYADAEWRCCDAGLRIARLETPREAAVASARGRFWVDQEAPRRDCVLVYSPEVRDYRLALTTRGCEALPFDAFLPYACQ